MQPAEPLHGRVVNGVGVGDVRRAQALYGAQHALDDGRRSDVTARVHGADLHRRLRPTDVVDDLAHRFLGAVDRQNRAIVLLPIFQRARGPLPAGVEGLVELPPLAVDAVGRLALVPPFDGPLHEVAAVRHCTLPGEDEGLTRDLHHALDVVGYGA